MREKEQHRSSIMSLPRQLEEILWKRYLGSWTYLVCLLAIQSSHSVLRSFFFFCLRGQSRIVRDRGDQPFAECFFLDLTWGVTHIDEEAIDRHRIQISGFLSTMEGI